MSTVMSTGGLAKGFFPLFLPTPPYYSYLPKSAIFPPFYIYLSCRRLYFYHKTLPYYSLSIIEPARKRGINAGVCAGAGLYHGGAPAGNTVNLHKYKA